MTMCIFPSLLWQLVEVSYVQYVKFLHLTLFQQSSDREWRQSFLSRTAIQHVCSLSPRYPSLTFPRSVIYRSCQEL